MDDLKKEIEALELSKDEQLLLDVVRNLEKLRASFQNYRRAVETISAKFDARIRALARLCEAGSPLCIPELSKNVLDLMSDDISRYYVSMHPQENVEKIKLIILRGRRRI